MQSPPFHTAKLLLAACALLLFIGALASLGGFAPDAVRAAAGDNVSGWAWSDTIGWVSFNGTDYGVDVDEATGEISGYAWSDAIGWIRFDPSAADGYPAIGPNNGAKIEDWTNTAVTQKPVTGWARACSVFQSGCSGSLKPDTARGGWDGWIKMSGDWTDDVILGAADAEGARSFAGFAWADTFGWIDMTGVLYGGTPVAPPAVLSVALTPETQSVESGTNANIIWEVRNATAGCTDTPSGWWKRADGSAITLDASGNGAGTVSVGPVTGPATYSLECADGVASVSDSAIVNANPFIKFFTADGYSATTIVGVDDTATLAWNTANTNALTDSCTIPGVTVAPPGLSGSATVSPDATTTYTLSCASGATAFDNSPRSVTVNFIPSGFILEPTPQNISITTIGVDGVGSGGTSNEALFHVNADSLFSDTVTLSINIDPFKTNPGSGYEYKFQVVAMCDDGSGIYAKCATQPGGLPAGSMPDGNGNFAVSQLYFWRSSYGIEFWIESTRTLPAKSDNTIRIKGEGGSAAPAFLIVVLDSRLFNPEYREF